MEHRKTIEKINGTKNRSLEINKADKTLARLIIK